jgi:hypothetical protein
MESTTMEFLKAYGLSVRAQMRTASIDYDES